MQSEWKPALLRAAPSTPSNKNIGVLNPPRSPTQLKHCGLKIKEYGQEYAAQKASIFGACARKGRLVARLQVSLGVSVYLSWVVLPAIRAQACPSTECRVHSGFPALVWYSFSFTEPPLYQKVDSGSLLKYGSYLSGTVEHMFLFCWFGNDILTESERLQLAAYSSDWTDASPRFRKELRVFLCRSHRPLVLTASKFCAISRQTFLRLMNASYSYFALLNQLSSE